MIKQLFAITLLFCFCSCKKDASLWQINNLNNGQISVFGHGGSGVKYRYPINSLHSLNHVLEQGVYGTEMDVQMTKDKELVLYHPLKLQDATNQKGDIKDKSLAELKNCHYRMPLMSPAKLISAVYFFGQLNNVNKYHYVFDTKVPANADSDYIYDFANALYTLIENNKLVNNCFIESYNTNFLQVLQAKNPELKLFIHSNTYQDALAVLANVKLFGITMDRTNITTDEIVQAHKKGLRVALFNLETEKENLEAIKMNPDYMQSDKCDYLLNALK